MMNFLVNRFNLTGASSLGARAIQKLYKNKVLFVHVPKCGGTSLSHALRVRYALSYFKLSEEASTAAAGGMSTGAWMRLKRDLVAYHAHTGAHFIQGHIPVDTNYLETHMRGYKLITLLRDPVDRVISHYFFDPRLREMTPEQFLESRRGFIETRVLCHFFGGLDWDEPGDVQRAKVKAIATLKRFDVVGMLEEPLAFETNLVDHLGLRLSIPKRNVGEHRANGGLSSEIIERIKEMCQADRCIIHSLRPQGCDGVKSGLEGV